ncbi:hypothetical protein VCHC50A1_0324, partial [Vibrio cholerae HC-50A1]
MEKALYGLLA